MVTTVARGFKWTPKEIMDLYVDDHDFLGLMFWYKDVKEQIKKLN